MVFISTVNVGVFHVKILVFITYLLGYLEYFGYSTNAYYLVRYIRVLVLNPYILIF